MTAAPEVRAVLVTDQGVVLVKRDGTTVPLEAGSLKPGCSHATARPRA